MAAYERLPKALLCDANSLRKRVKSVNDRSKTDMSSLQRSALSARLAKLPQLPPDIIPPTVAPFSQDDEDEEEESDDLGDLPQSMGPPKTTRRFLNKDPYSPVSATGYFDQAVEVEVPTAGLSTRVYYTPSTLAGANGTVMICHHGAGFSGLSFAQFAKEVKLLSRGECGVLSLDAREHGKTQTHNPSDDLNLSIETLCADLVALLKVIFPSPSEAPGLLLVGHSMGGSVIVRASTPLLAAKYKVIGVAVLDVVEGFTLEALPHMHNLLDSRPDGFDSPEDAIQWHITTNTIRNIESARISVPGMISPSKTKGWKWRTPLRLTAPYWANWFTGLSSAFLATRAARLLVLAGTDRLDKELMIGQMQGKFQMAVVPHVGHIVHEDDPTRLAEILVEFWKRNDQVLKGIKKVGEL